MEIGIKERVIGAMVLVVVAIIVIPILLQGHGDKNTVTQKVAVPVQNSQHPTVEYRMDLSTAAANGKKSPPKEASAGNKTTEVATPGSSAQTLGSSTTKPAASGKSMETAGQAEMPKTGTDTNQAGKQTSQTTGSKAHSSSALTTIAKPTSSTATTTAKGTWVVQVGSFSTASRAQTVADKLKTKGFKAYVLPFKTSDKTLYRVRVGPYADRASADKAVADVSAAYGGKVKVMPSE